MTNVSLYPEELCTALQTPQLYAHIYILIQVFLSFPTLFFLDAPYGKLTPTKTWTFKINHILGWFLMEATAWIVFFIVLYAAGIEKLFDVVLKQNFNDFTNSPYFSYFVVLTLAMLYPGHYIYRSLIYPHLQGYSSQMDVLPALLALVFNICNGLMHSHNLICNTTRQVDTLSIPLTLCGAVLFVICWLLCYHSDKTLMNLRHTRKPTCSTSHYVVPTPADSPIFYITYAPNYLFELLQWCAFAMITQNAYSSWLFVAVTFSNLFPRAVRYRSFYMKLQQQAELEAKQNVKKD